MSRPRRRSSQRATPRRFAVEADSLPREADRLLLARFAPACVLVNQALTILQFRGQTGPVSRARRRPAQLRPATGHSPGAARPDPSCDRRDQQDRRGVTPRRAVSMTREISIEVDSARRVWRPTVLSDSVRRRVPSTGGQDALSAAVTALTESEKDRRLAHLERELEGMREYMRAAIEEHEAVQEELRSAHEEMLSANEEFQSTNEELETSKEELQSTNEELTTTIDELRSRNQELARLNAELDAARRVSEAARSYADTIIQSVREPLGGARWNVAHTAGEFGIRGEPGDPA